MAHKENNAQSILHKITTIHGINHLTSGNSNLIAIWIVIIIGNVALTSYLVYVIKERFDKDTVYTTVDSSNKVNEVSFPCVTICNTNIISEKEKQTVKSILEKHLINDTRVDEFFKNLHHLLDFDYNLDTNDYFEDIFAILRHHYLKVDTLMEEIHQSCENLVQYCTFNRKIKKCSDLFSLVKTFAGYCCSFNYAALSDISGDPIEVFEAEEHGNRILSTSESGRRSGLTVLFNVEPNDYPDWSPAYYYGAKVLISDPFDYPEINLQFKRVSIGESLDIKVYPVLYKTDSEVQNLNIEKRSCYYSGEKILKYSDSYSYETCRTECRMTKYLELCGCIPYMYPRDSTTRICELSDNSCLTNITVFGTKILGELENCDCYLECDDKKYRIKTNILPINLNDYPENVTQYLNKHDLISLKVYFARQNCNSYKRKLLMDLNNLIASYGGVLSLGFGVSILTLLELFYIIMSIMWRTADVG